MSPYLYCFKSFQKLTFQKLSTQKRTFQKLTFQKLTNQKRTFQKLTFYIYLKDAIVHQLFNKCI